MANRLARKQPAGRLKKGGKNEAGRFVGYEKNRKVR